MWVIKISDVQSVFEIENSIKGDKKRDKKYFILNRMILLDYYY